MLLSWLKGGPPPGGVETEEYIYLRRNFGPITFDGAFFILGLSLVSHEAVLPACAAALGASNLVIGLIPVIVQVGWFLPPLLVANYVTRWRSKKNLLLIWTVFQRLPWLFLAGFFFGFNGADNEKLLLVLLAVVAVVSLANGAVVPVFLDLFAKLIPVERRGYAIAVRRTIGGVLGIGGGWLVKKLLIALPFPQSYAAVFACAFVSFFVSYLILFKYDEPIHPGHVSQDSFKTYLRRLPVVLRGNRNFASYIFSVSLLMVAYMAAGFYAVAGLRRFDLPDNAVGGYIMTMMITALWANFLVGWLGDRFGHRTNLVLATGALLAASVLALTVRVSWLYPAVFVCYSIGQSALILARFYLVLEFCRPEERPVFIGLANSLVAPFALSGLLGGRLADLYGYEVLFTVAAFFGLAALVWSILFVREPRWENKLQ